MKLHRPQVGDALSLVELDLYHRLMVYRLGLGLSAIPLSRSLTTTAGRHAADTYYNIWAAGKALPAGANLHSWSDAPYFDDHRDPDVMWFAPQRLGTPYTSEGIEISAAGYGDGAAALEGWKGSPGHNTVIVNSGVWQSVDWRAIGIGVLNDLPAVGPYGGRVYHVWFGAASDPAGPPLIRGSGAAERISGTPFDDLIDGSGGNDIIQGGLGSDRLIGGPGNDRLTGGAAADTFRFDSTLNSRTNHDRITDFKPAQGDRIELARSIVPALPAGDSLAAAAFHTGSGFTSRAQRILYNPSLGTLSYDSNGSAAGGTAAVFATLLKPPSLSHTHFTIA